MAYTHTVKPILVSTLKTLTELDFLNNFYLVGGTGLALQLGHRDSVDIDLFTHEPFDTVELANQLSQHLGDAFMQQSSNKSMLFCFVNEVKVDFVNTRIPLLFPTDLNDGFRIAQVKDIALLKFQAIMGRGGKKDFIDLYVLLQQYPLAELVELFSRKYPNTAVPQLLMSMTYFEDAEADAMPKLYINATWPQIKSFIQQQVTAYILP